MNKVFVYGSLLKNKQNHSRLNNAKFLGEAHTSSNIFSMYDLGDYPGVVMGGSSKIYGELYEVDNNLLSSLDRFEGHPYYYFRHETTFILNNKKILAYMYVYNQDVEFCTKVKSGSWNLYR